MKKLIQTLAATIMALGLMTGVASAQTITNGNGTDSTNRITNSSTIDININNSNDVSCDIDSDQDASSGDATANGNTTVGNVGSGDASNSANLGCSVNASNGPRPSNPGSQGGGTVAGVTTAGGQGGASVAGASSEMVAALPETGVSATVSNLAGATAGLGFLGIAAQAVVAAMRRRVLSI